MALASRRLERSATMTVVIILVTTGLMASEQSDSASFNEGRIAFDTHHDCRAAWSAFSSVSQAFRVQPVWVWYMAQTEECLGRLGEALKYYEQYDTMVPGQPKVVDKIGELRYQVRKLQDAEHQQQLNADAARRAAELRDAAIRGHGKRVAGVWQRIDDQKSGDYRTRIDDLLTFDSTCAATLVRNVKKFEKGFAGWKKVSDDTQNYSLACDQDGRVDVVFHGQLSLEKDQLRIGDTVFRRKNQ
jgi:hypothetical protein